MIKNNIFKIALGTGIILMIPLLFSWPWTLSDFIVMGAVLFTTGLLINLAIKKLGKYKIPAIIIIVFLFFWLWAELAVGVFTNWGS